MSSSSKILNIDPAFPGIDIIERAAEVIEKGGVVVSPTTCLYGLAADATNEDAVRKIFDIKKRPAVNPILVLVENQEMIHNIVVSIPPQAEHIMKTFWPGNITLVFEAKSNMPWMICGHWAPG